MSWANMVLPVFIGPSGMETLPERNAEIPDPIQIDTAHFLPQILVG